MAAQLNLPLERPVVNSPVSDDNSDQTVTVTPPSKTLTLALNSPEGIDCYGNERKALLDQGKFYNNPVLSDIKLVVGGQKYYSHKLILVKCSDVFERMFSSDWSDENLKEVELKEDSICIGVFPRFLKFLYTNHIKLNTDNSLPILILADKYNIVDLKNVCINFASTCIIPKLQLKDVFHIWFQYATKCYHQTLITCSVQTLSDKMEDITSTVEWETEWMNLDQDQLIEFLKSSELIIKDEYALWKATIKWLNAPQNVEKIQENLKKVLCYIRFPMMVPEQLCEIESSAIVEQNTELFQHHLKSAYKYHSLPLTTRANMKEFSSSAFLLRNYSDLRWDKRLIIPKYSTLPKGEEVSLRFATRASSFPAQTWEWELKISPKGFSPTCDDLRTILYSNLILDQPRPVEYLLSVVGSDQILQSVCGRKNFTKARYSIDTELEKKISVSDLMTSNSPLLVNDCLHLQIHLKPVE
ncbi:hypothetical protein LOTGIDRAFT_177842 [Lottia gigantea]|uniref:BTB domain-containing protein n=1 Tax=Lottia gigantea TaxID=225164 RepID=V4BAE0_LOTGI|nr:hypothetical protein LOTGIDRAFT_177842 [Lottia gigantea]ESP02912.1 hypothetical protein LOTGIDRAFT_177842 [Lottia gigantea]